MIAVVFSSSPKHFGYDIKVDEKEKHVIYTEKHYRCLFYTHQTPSVDLVYKSLRNCDKNKIFFFDQTKGVKAPIAIKDHINISGRSGLAGQTPFKSYEMFPDMSSIYKTSTAYENKTVFTVGPQRFSSENAQKKIISESAGIITPILHYIGGRVTAFGIPEQMKEKKEIVHKCLKTEALN
tara:strand:+ start:151 stop:690 length:540 start_codon:yes stop_codon:yes gene_type:complete